MHAHGLATALLPPSSRLNALARLPQHLEGACESIVIETASHVPLRGSFRKARPVSVDAPDTHLRGIFTVLAACTSREGRRLEAAGRPWWAAGIPSTR